MHKKEFILLSIVGVFLCVPFFMEPVPQDLGYHQFADQRPFLGLPNGMDVLSNIPFIIAGLWGLVFLVGSCGRLANNALLVQYCIFFAGILLTGLGSSYYHINPDNDTLFWDRLPMTIAFMAFFSSLISEQINRKAGSLLLPPLLLIGAFSVGYWAWTEKSGAGDLRLYALVQYLPLILTPLILVLYKSPGKYAGYVAALLVCYAASKGFELYDIEIYALGNMVSGHTLKHVAAALGSLCILKMLYVRKKVLAINPV